MKEVLEIVIFKFGSQEIHLGVILAWFAMLLAVYMIYILLRNRILRPLLNKGGDMREFSRRMAQFFILSAISLSIIASIKILKLDVSFLENPVHLKVSTPFQILFILLIARFFQLLFSLFLNRLSAQFDGLNTTKNFISKKVSVVIYLIAAMITIRLINGNFVIYSSEENGIHISSNHVIGGIIIFLCARIIGLFVVEIVLRHYYERKNINAGTRFAFNQLFRYFLYIITTIFALDYIGLDMKLIWGGLAALLLGVGFGLHQTINDFFSGIILLFERSVEYGDIINYEGQRGTIKKIGLRSSLMETRNQQTIVVPNHKIVNESVTNLTSGKRQVGDRVMVGVAYGTDVAIVKSLILKVALANEQILKDPVPKVFFKGFGESSLDFELLFYTRNILFVEDLRSDLYTDIYKIFSENNIEIPFPQRTVWMHHISDNNPKP